MQKDFNKTKDDLICLRKRLKDERETTKTHAIEHRATSSNMKNDI